MMVDGRVPVDGQAREHERCLACSFCGKGAEHVALLIAGHGAVYICDECVLLSYELVCASGTHRRVAGTAVQPSPPFPPATGHGFVGTPP